MNDIRDAFRTQARACAGLGSPFMERLMSLCADRLAPGSAVADRVLGWPDDFGPLGDVVPLRLAGALHGLVRDETDPEIARAYPPHEVPDDTLWAAVEGAFARHEARILRW